MQKLAIYIIYPVTRGMPYPKSVCRWCATYSIDGQRDS